MSNDEKRRWTGKGIGAGKGSAGRTAKKKTPAYNARTESSKRWIERQLSDPYVKKAQSAGYRSRAAFKLLELQEKFSLIRPNDAVVDLGAAPGGWVQVSQALGASKVVGIDLLEIEPIAGAVLLQGDVADEAIMAELEKELGGKADVVLSDMAANTTGHRQTDHLRTVALVELAIDFALETLNPGGNFCSKVFQGGTSPALLDRLKQSFEDVKHAKPPASRTNSPEIYVIAKGFRGN
ncbi:RlmE family RNA methyltransferase [Ponticaulis sp.]|uniref:RlmE family RNA methyltransferase n=1 Tax=Ponticaulis sp. TaxID=2020902 RepID=UPI000B7304EA|nr:RlmE family RNA methyltransferase [Ponticaulis sp.]MAI91505.1 rRNA methyltransferase [Ponticaulis sp.]OUX97468.1 MAG: rRNA methyltransferase [Hyphomonadaceae bacterium TMED5]|tara:strand:+ start:13706 stop:14416 length:711 start_codon:yes stop_codon:yes gene_type:complete